MTRLLELEFQLRGIDYTADNLVHADMSPEQFAESMRRRGESMFQLFFRMLGPHSLKSSLNLWLKQYVHLYGHPLPERNCFEGAFLSRESVS